MTAQSAERPPVALEEIIVTAQLREEDIRDVGISMAAFDARDIHLRTLRDLADISTQVANVEMFEDYGGGGLPTWVIRGVGLQDFNANNTPTAAVYVDEIYQTSTARGMEALFDVQRVEVLKGPQGGLYGRNTSGGAINLLTRSPQLGTDEGYINLEAGRWQSTAVEGAANWAAGDTLAFRLAGQSSSRRDGWQTSLVNGRTHGEKDRLDLRAGLRFVPAESFELTARLYGGTDDSETQLGRSVGLYGPDGTLCEPVRQGYRDDAVCLDWAGVNQVFSGEDPVPTTRQSDDGGIVLSDPINRHSNNYHGINLRLDYETAVGRLTSITAYDSFAYGVVLDLDGASGEYGHRPSSSDIETWSQQVRLASGTARKLSWVAGASLTNDVFLEDRLFLLSDNVLVGLVRGELSYRQVTQSRAVFGQLDYLINDNWSLMANVRYTSVNKRYREGNFLAPALPPPNDVFANNLSSDYELNNPFSGKIQLEWRPFSQLLVYGSLSRGFKEGGFYGGFPFAEEEVLPYSEEKIVAYEAGMKYAARDRGLSVEAAAFYYDYQDVQGFVTRTNPVTGSDIDLLTNQGDAIHRGVEVAMNWILNSGFFIDSSLGYLDAAWVQSGALTTNLLGARVPLQGRRPYAPRWNFSATAGMERNLAGPGSVVALVNYHYRSDFSGHLSSPADYAVRHLDGYGRVNGRVEIENFLQGLSLGLWINNLTNESNIIRIKSDGLGSFMDVYAEPRSWGLGLTYQW